jgi:hypothetical protein
MNRKEPQPLNILNKGLNPSFSVVLKNGRNPDVAMAQQTVVISRPKPPPAPPLPPSLQTVKR